MQKISIRNFGPIDEIDLEIKDFMVLIGPQASGKSTIAKLIYFFKSLDQDLLEYLLETDLPHGITRDGLQTFRNGFAAKLGEKFVEFFGVIRVMNPDFSLQYHYSVDRWIQLEKHQANDAWVQVTFSEAIYYTDLYQLYPQVVVYKGLKEQMITLGKKSLSIDAALVVNKAQEIEAQVRGIFAESLPALYIPAGRSLLAAFKYDAKLANYLDWFINQFLETRERETKPFFRDNPVLANEGGHRNAFESRFTRIIKGEYRVERDLNERIYLPDGRRVLLQYASSGQQEAIGFMLELLKFMIDGSPAFVVIEEPEAHLYPPSQMQAVEAIAAVFNSLSAAKFIITTHSPYILTSLDNLVQAHEIAAANPEKADQIADIVPRETWIAWDKLGVYMVAEGTVQDIRDAEYRGVGGSELDRDAETIGAVYERLLEIKYPIEA
ncbi:MAG: hypothetical protein OHK0039_11670 [Bacteroidia bacterium]